MNRMQGALVKKQQVKQPYPNNTDVDMQMSMFVMPQRAEFSDNCEEIVPKRWVCVCVCVQAHALGHTCSAKMCSLLEKGVVSLSQHKFVMQTLGLGNISYHREATICLAGTGMPQNPKVNWEQGSKRSSLPGRTSYLEAVWGQSLLQV